jgi:hypothetical protein
VRRSGLPVLAVLSLALVSGCAMMSGKPTPATVPTASTPRPSGPIELGDYEKASEGSIANAFAKEISGRYAAGAMMATAIKDLAENRFACAAPKAGTGDPPDQVCRRQVKASGCTYTYQVHLFDDPGGKAGLSRVRGLYDKACGEDLLGG